jgi:AraC family transcriptional regulator of adaptative response/methylated-DNA-[protein]-cysteine methyltransferase
MLDSDRCWQAIQDRDEAHDGRFFFGVMTTGVFCRPSCPSRTPLRKNVRFYATPADAEREGLRPCLRCRPLTPAGADPKRRTRIANGTTTNDERRLMSHRER